MRSYHGARFRNPHDVVDFVRIDTSAGAVGAWCLFACDSYEFPFSAGLCAAGARVFGDGFWAARAAGDGFDRSVASAIRTYLGAAPSLWQDDGFVGGAASATFLAAFDDGRIDLRWIGDHAAILVRDGEPVESTEPHCLAMELAKHGVDPRDHPHAGIITRTVSATDQEPARATWERRRGDILVVATGDAMLPWRARQRDVAELLDPAAPDAQLVAERLFDASPRAFGVIVTAIVIE